MITVHFVHGARSYLPELAAYQAHIEHLGHAAEAELLESAVELDQVHGSFSFALVMRSMTSR